MAPARQTGGEKRAVLRRGLSPVRRMGWRDCGCIGAYGGLLALRGCQTSDRATQYAGGVGVKTIQCKTYVCEL